MRLRQLWAASLCAVFVNGFQDTSPFLAFSTSDILNQLSWKKPFTNILSSSKIAPAIESIIKQCPSDTYVLVSQQGVSADDFATKDAAPHLRSRVAGHADGINSVASVANAIGQVDMTKIEETIRRSCSASVTELDHSKGQLSTSEQSPQLIKINLPSLPQSPTDRARLLKEYDTYLNAVITSLPHQSYTFIYTSTPPSLSSFTSNQQPQQQPTTNNPPQEQEQEPLYDYTIEDATGLPLQFESFDGELKRDVLPHTYARRADTPASNSTAPLFERYNYMSGGIYMGLVAAVLLLPILYVGISAVSSIEVSYAAFSKEMGPGGQAGKGKAQ